MNQRPHDLHESAGDRPAIAIVGMSGRFPGAATIAQFWNNVCAGVTTINRFKLDELTDNFDAETRARTDFVPVRSIIEDVDLFDAEFFAMLPRDAALTDPQQRIFLECCWEALESAGCDPAAYAGQIGVYAGSSINTYLLRNICGDSARIGRFTSDFQVGSYSELVGSLSDFLATRVCYKLDLKGPGVAVHSACSTSLLAVAQACQSLLNYQCDAALAGGVSITFPQQRGYLAQEGGMVSANGTCRPFDAAADGTVFGSGAGVVMLKRLADAVRDGDRIAAVLTGFGVNNDGCDKVGFAAPSVAGQANAVAQAHEMAGISSDEIGYVEAHGTGTPLGDPIEFAALVQAFRRSGQSTGGCALGSVKANVGHLDAAAGVIGLIKAALVLDREVIPPLTNFNSPNPHLDVESSPFKFVNTLTPWPRGSAPRKAGVSAFGVGGTNVHVVLEEAPAQRISLDEPDTPHAFPLSARNPEALAAARERLAEHLASHPQQSLADVAWTLQTGRRAFGHRFAVAGRSANDVIAALKDQRRGDGVAPASSRSPPKVAFMFPGQGAQYPGMGRDLYDADPVFRVTMRHCSEILQPLLGVALTDALYGPEPLSDTALGETWLAQPALFSVAYALAKVWEDRLIRPDVMVGHSIGEFVAGAIAGVFQLPDVLRLIAARGRLMQNLPRGGMLSVRLGADRLRPYLDERVSLAAINSPCLAVAAGPIDALASLESRLSADGVLHRRLHTSHAFHSAMMDSAVPEFLREIEGVSLAAPKIAILSSVTGRQLSDAEATSPRYWAHHMRETVRFADAIGALANDPSHTLLEVGAGTTLATLARQNGAQSQAAISTLSSSGTEGGECLAVMAATAALWQRGVAVDWRAVHGGSLVNRRRVPLPTYAFQRKRHWIDEPQSGHPASASLHRMPDAASPIVNAVNPANSIMLDHPPSVTVAEPPSLPPAIECGIVAIIAKISGLSLGQPDHDRSFLDLGLDSLVLTQVARAVHGEFGVKIAFRQLMGEQDTVTALAKFLAERSPKAAAMAQPQVTPPLPAAPAMAAPAVPLQQTPSPVAGAAVEAPAVERLLREQLQLVDRVITGQFEALRRLGALSTDTAHAAAAGPVTVRPSAAVQQSAFPAAAASLPVPQEGKAFGPFKAVQPRSNGELTPHQRTHLDALIARTVARTPKSKAQTQANRAHLADPRVVSGFRDAWKEMIYPIVASASKGSRIRDIDGNDYIDLLNGFGPIMFGHRPDFVEDAVRQQMSEGFEIGPQTPLAGEIAQLFCELTGNERMTFCNTGSEAVMAAFRLARTVTGRDKIVTFNGAYHGMFDEVLVSSARTAGGEPGARAIAPGIPDESVSNIVVLEYGAQSAIDWIKANADNVAAVIVEPVQSRRPDFQPVAFLHDVRRVTAETGSALIFDEVVTGFRSHPGGCQTLFGIRADMATYGKVAGGGMPVGILGGKADYLDALDGGAWQYGDQSVPEAGMTFFAGTFVRHPLTLAAVKAVLTHIKQAGPQLQEELSARTANLVTRINAALDRHGTPARLANFTSVFYFKFAADERLAGLFYYLLREQGLHILEGFPCFLTTAHSDADLDKVVAGFEAAARAMRDATFFNARAQAERETEPPHAPVAKPSRVRLTEPQREIFLAAMLSDEASSAFNEGLKVGLEGQLDATALERAFQAVVAHHDGLRGSIDADGEHLNIAPALDVRLPVEDIGHLSTSERQAALDAVLTGEARTPFDLYAGPLIRARLVRLECDRHALVLCGHHIVCDGWSINVILRDLTTAYSAIAAGRPVVLPEAVSFGAYAASRADEDATEESSSAEAYWLSVFDRLPAAFDLPSDRPRGDVRTYAGATTRCEISAEVVAGWKEFAGAQRSSLFALLLAGFQAMAARLASTDDIVTAVPMAGQSLIDNGSLVGHCVNFLPVRTRIPADATFLSLLRDVRGQVLDAKDNQSYTYGTLVSKLGIKRDPSRLPLTSLQFNLEQIGGDNGFDGLKANFETVAKAAVNSEIFVNVVEHPAGLTVYCDYNTDLFDRQTIERWIAGYQALVSAGIAAPGKLLSAITVAELGSIPSPTRAVEAGDALVDSWNDTVSAYPRGVCLHALIEQQVRRSPQATAVTQSGVAVTYAELNARSNRLARQLSAVGAKPGSLVGICLDRSPDMIVALLAVMKSGAAYVPLDPTHPADRIAFVLQDSGIDVIVSQERLASLLPQGTQTRILVDRDAAPIAANPAHDLELELSPEARAYVMYTSGSTGKPKGVAVPHRALVNFMYAMKEQPGLCGTDVVAAVTTITFDISGLEIYLPLVVGARVELVPPEIARDACRLSAHLPACGATVLQATPATWRMMLDANWAGQPNLRALCGGEALPRDLAEAILLRVGELWNMYGPTETTIWSTIERVVPGLGAVAIGRPIANTQIYIVDEAGHRAPVGTAGEIWIAGDGVALGYHNRAELTAERFLPDTFSATPGGVLYRSGDLGRWMADGRLEHLGRLDNQVKVRGFRVELGEIEATVQAVPGVRQTHLVADMDDAGSSRLVAFCVLAPGAATTTDDIVKYAASQLPSFMVPVSIVLVDAFPLNVSGKIDRSALLTIERKQRAARVRMAPETPHEVALTAIVVEVLAQADVGVTDNLFEIGMDSLKIFQIASRATKAGLVITPLSIMKARTIRGALRATAEAPPAPARATMEIKAVSRDRYRTSRQTSSRIEAVRE